MSDCTPTTEEVRAAYIGKPAHWLDESIGAEFDRWLAQHDAELLAGVVPEEIRIHWEWAERRRARFKDRDCVCGACQMMANISRITGRSEGEQ